MIALNRRCPFCAQVVNLISDFSAKIEQDLVYRLSRQFKDETTFPFIFAFIFTFKKVNQPHQSLKKAKHCPFLH